MERIIVGGSKRVTLVYSRRQSIYRTRQGQIELVWPLSLRPPVERAADFSTEQPELNAIRFVGHRVLVEREPGADRSGRAGDVP